MEIFGWIIYIFGSIAALLGLSCLCYMIWEVIETYRNYEIFTFLYMALRCRKDYEYAYKVMRKKIFIWPPRIIGKRKLLKDLKDRVDVEVIIGRYYEYNMPG